MPYTEIQNKGNKKYFYLAHTVRVGSKYKKIRVFLGVNLTEDKLVEEISKKRKILNAKILIIEKTEKEPFVQKIYFTKSLISNSKIMKIDSLKKKYQKKIKLSDKDILQKVRESFLISYTYNTNSAEGNTITLKETELIISKGIVPKSHSLREIHEIENTVKAYEYIESYDGPLNHHFILTLHKLVTQNTLQNPKNEGKYRKSGQNVAMTGSEFFPPKGGRQIKKLIDDLIKNYTKCTLSKVESTVLFHSAFILIHPFIDGNGRVSRLIFNWMIIKENLPPIDFPSKNHLEYTDLMGLSRSGDSKPLADYLYEQLMSSKMSTF